jgi:ferredoxin
MSVDQFSQDGGVIHVNRDLCGSCGACVAVCPMESLVLINLTLTINQPSCNLCRRCLRVCPVRALTLAPTTEFPRVPKSAYEFLSVESRI